MVKDKDINGFEDRVAEERFIPHSLRSELVRKKRESESFWIFVCKPPARLRK